MRSLPVTKLQHGFVAVLLRTLNGKKGISDMPATIELDANGLWRIQKYNFLYWAETRTEAELLRIVLDNHKWSLN